MTLQYSVTLQDDQLNEFQSVVGSSGTFLIYTGTVPATCATSASGSLLCTITLPATFMASASAGSVALTGTWSGTASGTGTAGYFRINASTTCHLQGSIATSGSDLNLNNTSVTSGQTITITGFTVSTGNA